MISSPGGEPPAVMGGDRGEDAPQLLPMPPQVLDGTKSLATQPIVAPEAQQPAGSVTGPYTYSPQGWFVRYSTRSVSATPVSPPTTKRLPASSTNRSPRGSVSSVACG